MQLACLRTEHLPTRVEVCRNPRLNGQPVIVTTRAGSSGARVLDASPEAVCVSPGMPLSQALSRCAGAILVDPDPLCYARVFDDILTAIEALGADVEEEELGLAYVRLSGLELLFGGMERLIAAIWQTLPPYLDARLGIGSNKFLAALDSITESPSVDGVPRAARQSLAARAPGSLEQLPVPWQLKSKLHGFGLHTLAQVAALPLGALQAQFGPVGKQVWELANGIDRRPLVPRRHEETIAVSLSFSSPTVTLSAIATATESLLVRAFAQPAMRGRFARTCTLEASVFRAPHWQKRMVFREPIGDPRRAAALVAHTLECAPPPGPLEEVRIVLSGITGEAGRQESLFSDVRRHENLKETLSQLKARLSKQPPIYQIREVEPWSRLPERRQALVPYVP
jgi:nucleotidyltransferase/DNA polymerase involved in DNA repair